MVYSQKTIENNDDASIPVQHQLTKITSGRCWCGYKRSAVICTIGIIGIVVAIALTLTLTFIYLPRREGDAAITTKVDEYIKVEMQKRNIPGVSLAVLRSGQIIHGKGYGYSNVENEVLVKPETIFQSASVGKQFVSMAVMILVEKRKIELDDKIIKFFTDAPNEWSNITIRHLLTHTSGMSHYVDGLNLRADYTEDGMCNKIMTLPLAFPPGEQWSYSNVGYIMLGILIRRVTNQFYGDFLKESIFDPLQMTTAQVISEADIIPNRASGYVLVNNVLQNQGWVSPSINTMADGSLYLTIYDMAKWDMALYGNELLKNQTSFDAMWSPVRLNNNRTYPYGFGWDLAKAANGMRIIQHSGSWQGFRSMIIRVPEDKLTVVYFANLNSLNVIELAKGVLEIYNSQLTTQSIQDN